MTRTNPDPTGTGANDRTYTMERIFNAPRDIVWKAWTEPERIAQWWGPRGFTTTVKEMNVTPGGTWLYGMSNPEFMDGQPSWGKGIYSEVLAPEKLVYTDYFTDENGNVQPDMPSLVTTVLFDDLGGKTKVTSRAIFATREDLEKVIAMGMEQGANETWDRLEELLAQ
jgi:uncharacterized protein YndB with AHSA1/START domain